MTSYAFSYKDFESSVQSPLKKQLLLKVVSENFKDQVADIKEYDVLKSLRFSGKTSEAVHISEKQMTTSYMDSTGKYVDANQETASKIYGERIDIIPNSIPNSLGSTDSAPML
mmetsp:Transcript_16349/g.18753  ORF Transcript_16349/g.18753 Transcript_16349/m.18753 type:complete len:113 (-) Transcript_16349:68-406(-)